MDLPQTHETVTLADHVAGTLVSHGVRRMFGIPGGGSSLALIEAAGRLGIDFILTRTETAAAIMAGVTGELTGTPGVVLTGIGPGAASAVNGIAYAYLEKAPVVLFTDGPAASPHQAIDQNALYAPITKFQGRLRPETAPETLEAALACARQHPRGPVQLDMTAPDAQAPVSVSFDSTEFAVEAAHLEDTLDRARNLINASRRPVLIAGLEARYADGPATLRTLADALGCPVLLTYKASGTLPADHPGYAGLYTGAEAEADVLHAADLIVLFGFDAIEAIPGQWPYVAPILDLTPAIPTPLPRDPDCRVIGALDRTAAGLSLALAPGDWTATELTNLRKTMAKRLALSGTGHTAQTIVEAASRAAPAGTRLTVDSGAHMFAAMACWPARDAFGVLKSNGLSTMGFALPAAIASSLQEPDRPVIAVTGDGGLAMSLSELATATEHGCDITVLVVNDAALSLIDIKQHRQQLVRRGVRTPSVDFVGCARALDLTAWHVDAGTDLSLILTEAFKVPGQKLIDISADPSGYADQLERLRG